MESRNSKNIDKFAEDKVNEIATKNEEILHEDEIQIEGKYELTPPELESILYSFDWDTVTYESLELLKGNYKIIGNKIEITYNEAYDPEGQEMTLTSEQQKEILTIIDENTLTMQIVNDGNTYNSKYIKK